ncbi:MAG: flagellar M-ring protein FliF C-terminal domain-containing protein, partial [Myxococcota bacterium]
MAALLSQLRAFHAGLDPARRRVLWGAAAAAIVAVIGVGVWASQPSYVVLTRASDGDEAAAVTRALAEAGLPYRIDADGLTVRVPAPREIDARRAAAGDEGIVGLEGLEKIDPWVTPFQEQLHRQRMLQGELVRTIEGIAGIQAATVQLDLPEPSAFLRDVTRPTAAVTLRPDAGQILDVRTARSVAELVSHAVAGMGAEDVSVVDASSGRTLWGGDRADLGAEGALAVDAAHREAALAASVRSALTTLLGRDDAAAVTVRVELESAQVQQTVNAVDPASAVAATERIETEIDTRGDGVAAGAPGTDANLAERATTTNTGSRTRETQQTSYQFTTTTT